MELIGDRKDMWSQCFVPDELMSGEYWVRIYRYLFFTSTHYSGDNNQGNDLLFMHTVVAYLTHTVYN